MEFFNSLLEAQFRDLQALGCEKVRLPEMMLVRSHHFVRSSSPIT